MTRRYPSSGHMKELFYQDILALLEQFVGEENHPHVRALMRALVSGLAVVKYGFAADTAGRLAREVIP